MASKKIYSQEKPVASIKYETDEEELSKETDWLADAKLKNKKREASSSSASPAKQLMDFEKSEENKTSFSLNSTDYSLTPIL